MDTEPTKDTGSKMLATQNGNVFLDHKKGRFVVNSDNIPIALFGVRNDGSVGWDLTTNGKDVTTASIDDLVASSRFRGFKILDIVDLHINNFNVPAHSQVIGSVMHEYDSGITGFQPIVLGFTNSLPSAGLFLWQGVSPESVLQSPSGSSMGFTVYVRFDTLVLPDSPTPGTATIQFNATVRNATGGDINDVNYDVKAYILTETAGS